MLVGWLRVDLEAHRASGAAHLLLGGLEVVGVQVGHLDLGDFFDVGLGHLAGSGLAGRLRALGQTGLLTQQHRGGRRLQDEGERAIFEDGDLDRDDRADLTPRWPRCTA